MLLFFFFVVVSSSFEPKNKNFKVIVNKADFFALFLFCFILISIKKIRLLLFKVLLACIVDKFLLTRAGQEKIQTQFVFVFLAYYYLHKIVILPIFFQCSVSLILLYQIL